MPIKGTLSGRIPIHLWTDIAGVESSALQQLKDTTQVPILVQHLAAMPDVHTGAGATIGSVLATQGGVIPSAVGVDIGCGMCAMRLDGVHPSEITLRITEIRSLIERSIPVGFTANQKSTKAAVEWKGWQDFDKLPKELFDNRGKGRKYATLRSDAEHKLCSLGGGNHFIELSVSQDLDAWVVLHSGSRNIGLKLANHFIGKAKEICASRHLPIPNKDLAYLPADTDEFHQYMFAVQWAQNYAEENREQMLGRVLQVMDRILERTIDSSKQVNCHHNFVQEEEHFGQKVLITRKGAIQALKGQMGIIPGSMGSKSYIVRGLGNPDAFNSASHGAGRKMSRSEAKRTFTLEDALRQTEGVECKKDESVLDELPGAYKDIDVVMANQTDLVEKVETLKQLLCIKG